MTSAAEVEQILDAFAAWAPQRPDVLAVGLIGSWARGAAGPGSDIDVVVVSADPERRARRSDGWPPGLPPLQAPRRRRWGFLLAGATELEVGVVPVRWAEDPRTQRIVDDGLRIVYDPQGRLRALQRTAA